MPNFPRYESKGTLTTQTPSAPAPVDTSGQIMEQTAKVGQTVQDIALKWSNAVDTIQKTTATANFKSGLLDIHNRAQNDPEYNNSDQYFKEIEQLKQDSLKGFSSKATESEMALNLGYEAKVGQIQVQNLYKKKMIDVGQAKTLDLIKTETDNPTDNSFPTIKNIVDTQVKAGLMHPDDAQKLLEKANKDLGINRVYNDLNAATTFDQADQVAQKVKSGAYETGGIKLSPEEKAKLVKTSETMARQIATKDNFAGRIERQNLVHDLMDQSNNGILKGQTLEEAFLTKGISNSTYNALSDNATSKVGPTAGTDHQTYYDLTHYLLSDNVNPEEAIKRILDANSAGKLSRDDQKKLYEMHLIPQNGGKISLKDMVEQQPRDAFDKMKSEYDVRTQAINDKRRWFSPAFKSFDQYFTGPDKVKNVVEATQKLVDNVQKNNIPNEQIPTEADKILGQSNLQKHPEWAKFPVAGQAMHDRFGNQVTVFPDGRVVRRK